MKVKNKFKEFILVTAIVLISATVIGLCVGMRNLTVDTNKVGFSDYKIGAINESGKIVESKQSIYMVDVESVDGLDIDVDEDTNTISYKVAFYDVNGDFISMTESLEQDFDVTNVPENAKTFRVVITPYQIDGENVTLTIFNVSDYIKQIKVVYNK